MYDEMKQYIEQHELLRPSQKVLLAVSGGPDSMVLAHLFYRLREEWSIELHAVQLNHKLRSTAAAESELVASYMEALHIPLTKLEEDIAVIADTMKESIEAAGHHMRREAFKSVAMQNCCEVIALAHHMDDRAETVLMNLVRGSGLSGLSAMRPKEDDRIRPLLFARKVDILKYAERHRVPYAVDESNADTVYTRNKFRHDIIPLLSSVNCKAVPHIVQSAVYLEEAEEALRIMTNKCAQLSLNLTQDDACSANREIFLSFPIAIRKRLLLKMARHLQPERISLSQKVIDQVVVLASDVETDKCICAGDNLLIFIEKADIVFINGSLQDNEIRYHINWDFHNKLELTLPGGFVCFHVRHYIAGDEHNKFVFLPPISEKVLHIRTRRSDDVIAIAGVGHKRVKKIFQESGLPARLRDRWPLVCDEHDTVLWIPGIAVADKATYLDTNDVKMGICIESVSYDVGTWNKIIAEAIQEDVNE